MLKTAKDICIILFLICIIRGNTYGRPIVKFQHLAILNSSGEIIYEDENMIFNDNNFFYQPIIDYSEDRIPIVLSINKDGSHHLYPTFTDHKGNVLYPPTALIDGEVYEFIRIEKFIGDYCIVGLKKMNKSYNAIIDSTGKIVLNPTECFVSIDLDTSPYFIVYDIKTDLGVTTIRIYMPNNILLSEIATSMTIKGIFSNGLVPVSEGVNDKKYGYMDYTGKVIIPLKYDYAQRFSSGYAVVGKLVSGQMKYSYLDKYGKVMSPFIYDNIEPFTGTISKVCIGKNTYLINSTGKKIYKFKDKNSEYYVFNNQIMVYKKTDKSGVEYAGILELDGKWIIKPNTYTYLTFINEGLAIGILKEGKFIINKQGERIRDISWINGIPTRSGFLNKFITFEMLGYVYFDSNQGVK